MKMTWRGGGRVGESLNEVKMMTSVDCDIEELIELECRDACDVGLSFLAQKEIKTFNISSHLLRKKYKPPGMADHTQGSLVFCKYNIATL